MKKSSYKSISKISLIVFILCILNPSLVQAFVSTISIDADAPLYTTYENIQRYITRTSDNALHAVYKKNSQIFYAKSEDNGITWQEEQITFESSWQGMPTICSDSEDTLHVCFSGKPGGWSERTIRHMKKPAGGTWSDITNLAPDDGQVDKNRASISVDSQDNLHVAWTGRLSGCATLATGIAYRKYFKYTDSWGDIICVAGGNWTKDSACLVVDTLDNVWIFWGQQAVPNYLVKCKKYDQQNDTWIEYSNLGDVEGLNPLFAASDPAGNIHLTYIFEANLYYRQYDKITDSWGNEELLSSVSPTGHVKPNISVDINNNTYIAYASDSDIHLLTNASGDWVDEIIDTAVHPVLMNAVYPVIGQQYVNIPESYILSYRSDSTLLLTLALSSPGVIQLPQTGQDQCYDSDGNVILCDGTGQDGEFKNGVPWPDPRFTDHGNGTIMDNLTGLTWTKNANLPNGALIWQEALNYVAAMNAGIEANYGHTDWRLPNINELESLVNIAEASGVAWLSEQGFINVEPYPYWSSTTYVKPKYAYGVEIGTLGPGSGAAGSIWAYEKLGREGHELYVWPVRGATSPPAQLWRTGQTQMYALGDDGELQMGIAWPEPRFSDNGDGTVTDHLTGLMWLKDANCASTIGHDPNGYGGGRMCWQDAMDFVAGINNGTYQGCGADYNDWRLPNRKELHSIIDFSQVYPSLPSGHPFVNVQDSGGSYWTSSARVGNPREAWQVHFYNGYIYTMAQCASWSNWVWPVRGGEEFINQPPVIESFAVDPECDTDILTAKFTCTASDPDDDPIEYTIDYGDGSPLETNYTGVFYHTYSKEDSYEAICIADDGINSSSSPITSASTHMFCC